MNGTTLEEPPPRTRAQHGGPGSRHPWADVTRELLTQMTGQDIVAALMIAGALIATWPLLMRPPGTPALVPLVAHVAGMLAGFGVLVVLLFVARTPVLERDVGADVLSRWHATTAKYALGLILLHACAATLGWAQSRGEPLAISALHVLRLPWIPAATVATVLMLVVGGMSVRVARRRLRHERWHAMHLLMYLAIALGFAHQLAGPDFVGHRWLQIAWSLAYTYVFALVIRHRVMTPMRRAMRHRLRVTDVHIEGAGVLSITVTGDHLDELHAESGQFFRWRFLSPDHWLNAHPFSLSAPPRADRLRLTVKALGDSTRTLQNLEPGTWVLAEGPYGAVTSARRTRRNVLLIAGGVGITPMRALFETMPLRPGDDLLLLYRARSEEELLFRDELDVIADKRGARVHYLLGEDRHAMSSLNLLRLVPDLTSRDVFMCGPPGLSDAVRRALRDAGLPDEQLHEERFSF